MQDGSHPCLHCPKKGGTHGATNQCFFGQREDAAVKPRIMVVTLKPTNFAFMDRKRLHDILAPMDIGPEQVFWTAAVKCVDKTMEQSKSHCIKWLNWEIQQQQPELIITMGGDAQEYLTGSKRDLDSVGDVRLRKTGDHPWWHLHLQTWRDIDVYPDRQYFQSWALNKIPAILGGAYPKDPTVGKDYFYATTEDDVHDWFKTYPVEQYSMGALDIESGGKDEWGSVGLDEYNEHSFIIGCSFSAKPGTGIFYDATVKNEWAGINVFLDHVEKYWLIFQNGYHDLKWIRVKWNRNLWHRFFFDTMLADHNLREWDRKRNLKRLADLFLPEFEDYEQPLYHWFNDQGIDKNWIDYNDLPRPMLATYGCMDTDVTLRLFHLFSQWLQEAGLWNLATDHVRKTQRVYGDDMHLGWGFNHGYYKEIQGELAKMIQDASGEIKKLDLWKAWSAHKEVDLRLEGKAFWDDETQCAYKDTTCAETVPPHVQWKGKRRQYYWPLEDDNGKPSKAKRAGQKVKVNTYTWDELEPDPTLDSFKRDILYDHRYLGLTPKHFTDKKKVPSASEVAMIFLQQEHGKKVPALQVFVKNTLKLSKANKYSTTYVKPAYWHQDKDGHWKRGYIRGDGGIHPTYMLAGAEDSEGGTNSGRPSAKKPNQLNIPSRGPDAKKIKKLYIPVARDVHGKRIVTMERWYLVQWDYSQLELRVLAENSGEPFMLEAYANNKDLHTELAAERFGNDVQWYIDRLSNTEHPEFQLAYDQRGTAKTSWFAYIYGAGADKLIETLAKQGIWIDKATMLEIINGLRSMLPMVEQYRQEIISRAPVAFNRFGRRRYVANINSVDERVREKAARQLFNFVTQSDAADLCSRGMYLFAEFLREQRRINGLRTYIMGNVYDSVIAATPESELNYMCHHGQRILENPDLPFHSTMTYKVDVEHGPSWGELTKWTPTHTKQA